MDFTTWFAFAAASIVLLLIPGPTVLLVVSYALTQGKRVAVATAAGVALGDFTAMTLSLAGLGALLLTSATMFTALKWIGAAYLVYLGIRLWRSEPQLPTIGDGAGWPGPAASSATPSWSPRSTRRASPSSSPSCRSSSTHDAPLLPQLVIMEATFVTLAAMNALVYALAADQLRLRIRRPGVLKWLNRAGAGCLVGMGAATAAISRN